MILFICTRKNLPNQSETHYSAVILLRLGETSTDVLSFVCKAHHSLYQPTSWVFNLETLERVVVVVFVVDDVAIVARQERIMIMVEKAITN